LGTISRREGVEKVPGKGKVGWDSMQRAKWSAPQEDFRHKKLKGDMGETRDRLVRGKSSLKEFDRVLSLSDNRRQEREKPQARGYRKLLKNTLNICFHHRKRGIKRAEIWDEEK